MKIFKQLGSSITSFKPATSTEVFLLFAIIALGGLLSLCRVGYGLPYLYDFDEQIFVDRAYYMLGNRDLNPGWFGAPASITIYLLCIAYGLIFVGGMVLGIFKSPSDLKELYFNDPTIFYLSGRCISVFFGLLSIVMMYCIACRLMNRQAGYIAAFITAILPLNVALSSVIRMDAPMVVFVLVAFWFSLDILETLSWRSHILAGAAIGLGIACKYPAVFFAPLILIAHVIHTWKLKAFAPLKIAASAGASIAACFLAAPFVFLDFQNTLQDVIFESRSEHLGATSTGFFQNLTWYISVVLNSEFGWFGFLLGCTAITYALYQRHTGFGLAAFAIVTFIVPLSGLSLRWDRWLLPIFPFFAIFLANAIVQLSQAIAVKQGKRSLEKFVMIALTVIIAISPLSKSLADSKASLGTDTRTLAAEWIQQKIPNGSRILVELRAPQLSLRSYKIFQVDETGKPAQISPATQDSDRFIPQFRFIGNLSSADLVTNTKIDYVVTAGGEERYRKERDSFTVLAKDTTQLNQVIAIYEAIKAQGTEVYRIEPQPGRNRGPEIKVYKLN